MKPRPVPRPQTRDEVVTTATEVLRRHPKVPLALLYGSAARNQLGAHSDIDIAVGCGRPLTWEERTSLVVELSEACERDIDLVDLETLTGLLQEFLWYDALYLKKDTALVERYIRRAQGFVEDVKPAMMATIRARLTRAFGVTL